MPRVCVWYVRQRVMVAVHHEMIKFNNCKSPSILHVRYHSLGLKTWHKQCENNVYWNTCHFTQPCENFSVPESSSLSFQCFSNLISIELLYEVGRGICWNPWDNIVHLEVEHFLANLAQIFNCFIKAYCKNYWNHERSHNEPPNLSLKTLICTLLRETCRRTMVRTRFKITRYKCKFCITDNHALVSSNLLRVAQKLITAQPNKQPQHPQCFFR